MPGLSFPDFGLQSPGDRKSGASNDDTDPLESVILALSGSFGLFLALDAGLLVMLSLTNLLLNAGLRAVSLETTKSAV